MIFATVGTHQQPFERMLDGLRALPDQASLVVQYGYAAPPPGVGRAVAFMSFDEMEQCFDAARAVITHAGVGSILCARRAGHRPVVVPRLRSLGEHVDDHQVELTQALAEQGVVEPAWKDLSLAEALERVPARRGEDAAVSDGTLAAAVRKALFGDSVGAAP